MRPGGDAPLEASQVRMVADHAAAVAPTELGVRFPHGVEDDGELAGDGDARLLEPELLGQPEAPCLQRREAGRSRQQSGRGLVEMLSRHLVAVLGDAPVPADLAGLVASRREAEVGARTG